ncbi:hypothetical protein DERF_006479 [Dermatophagoides farinae]|uniref:Uncharacterized protein n=1 Tax=Dermatophagoides farinae TaxID=6954 RepID=A0A922LC57_DERFA|nr:hypothetical protein DERF_006479 [Dermatophagoides farinae]
MCEHYSPLNQNNAGTMLVNTRITSRPCKSVKEKTKKAQKLMHNDNTSIKDESRWTITVVNYLGFCFQPRQEYGNNEDGFQPSPRN